jgi:glycosyltransferase involved in cell wall biosynthesis
LPGADFVELGKPIQKSYDVAVVFVLPVDGLDELMAHYRKKCTRIIYYTICETRPVNEAYGKLLELSPTVYTSSDFCASVFKEQFPHGDFRVLRLYAFGSFPKESLLHVPWAGKYTFYHIGNVVDPRKNMKVLLQAFKTLDDPNTALVLKATCKWKVETSQPNVYIINDFLTHGQMEALHDACQCYVSCSHSEGAGMGAVEAAMRDKPVIIQEYGATKEYIQTPYIIPCTEVPVGTDDFLFKKEHTWGDPDPDVLLDLMKTARDSDIRTWDHTHTRNLMDQVSAQLKSLVTIL